LNLDVTCGRFRFSAWWHLPQAGTETTGFQCGATLTTSRHPAATPSPIPTTPAPAPLQPGWQGLGVPPIGNRTRTVDPDTPMAEPRAYTTGPDGKPIAAARSYADQAADVASTHNNGT
jgi:hypothetical protein